VTRPRDWKAGAELAPPDYGRHEREHGPFKLSEPVVTRMPPRDEPPAAEITLERILAVLQSAQQRESQPEPAAQSSTASQSDGQPRGNSLNRLSLSK
jgi:hypothetical protein